jgi:hypothetical protein
MPSSNSDGVSCQAVTLMGCHVKHHVRTNMVKQLLSNSEATEEIPCIMNINNHHFLNDDLGRTLTLSEDK